MLLKRVGRIINRLFCLGKGKKERKKERNKEKKKGEEAFCAFVFAGPAKIMERFRDISQLKERKITRRKKK